ncbi:SNARE domain [Musa troglodytarum]|uniref:SNARE domain n=1 Tax=Musa troglodytarum TaxID=320322 RepID=A0A9E7I1C2_9LILI|nr:SNARE domain [Musa troglodytarum]
MASSLDQWMREFNEASKLSEDISAMMSERGSLPPSGPDTQRHLTAMRRKITILRTRLDSLESLLSKLPSMQPIKDKDLHKRHEMLANMKSKANQMASTLNMSNLGNREDLFGDGKKSADVMSRTSGLDNQGIVALQRQVMREQDEGLEKLEETVLSTKHIALAVNEELDLHTRLIDDLDQHVDVTDSRLQVKCYSFTSLACINPIVSTLRLPLTHPKTEPVRSFNYFLFFCICFSRSNEISHHRCTKLW